MRYISSKFLMVFIVLIILFLTLNELVGLNNNLYSLDDTDYHIDQISQKIDNKHLNHYSIDKTFFVNSPTTDELIADLSHLGVMKGGLPYLAGLKDLTNDDIDDLILIIEHIDHPTLSGFSLLLLDGVNLLPIINPGQQTNELIGEQRYFGFSTSYAPFSNRSGVDVAILFESPTQLCGGILFNIDTGIDYFGVTTFERGCDKFQFWEDINFDGFSDFVTVDELGNTFGVDLKQSFEANDTIDFAGANIVPSNINGEVENLLVQNLNNDGIVDYSFSRYHQINDTSTLYFVDGNNASILSSINVNGAFLSSIALNMDNSGNQEIIVQSSINGELMAFSSNASILEYNSFPFSSSNERIRSFGDIDNDAVDDILIIDNIGSIFVLSGKTGNLILPAVSTIDLGISAPIRTSISVLPLTEQSSLIVYQNQKQFHLYSQRTNTSSEILLQVEWGLNILSENVNENHQVKINYLDEVNIQADKDEDSLLFLNEFLLGSDDSNEDTDGDGLDDFNEFLLRTSLLNNDTDYDGMPDNFEVEFDLNPRVNDGAQDADADGLSNLREYQLNIDPTNDDSDDDGMTDGWEVQNGLNPNGNTSDNWDDTDSDGLKDGDEFRQGTNPQNFDTDFDQMDDGWEVDNSLDPLFNDANLDPDNDSITNLDEYVLGLNPRNGDQDDDGLPDGWEIDNDLDPLDPTDSSKDPDSDFIPNKLEYKYGLNPTGKYDQFIVLTLITLLIGVPVLLIIIYRRLSLKAKSEGFDNYRTKRNIMKLGFSTVEELNEAKALGFSLAEARNLIQSYGVKTIAELTEGWLKECNNISITYTEVDLTAKVNEISSTVSPLELASLEQNYQTIFRQMQTNSNAIQKFNFELQSILELIQRSKKIPIIGITSTDLVSFHNSFNRIIKLISLHTQTLDVSFKDRKTWFSPWKSLLILIQITGDMVPVSLNEIAEITNTTETHIEKLLQSLLSENPSIGNYNTETNVYTKGTNIDDYIEQALKEITKSEVQNE